MDITRFSLYAALAIVTYLMLLAWQEDYPPAIAPLPLTFLSNYFEHWMGWSNKNQKDDVSGKRERNRILQRLK